MKPSLTFLMIFLLALGLVACGGSPTAQEEIESRVEDDSTLSKVALEVSSIA